MRVDAGEVPVSFVLELKHHEVAYVGRAVLRNEGDRARITIDGHVPILREKEFMDPLTAKSPAENLYVAIQEMYLSGSDDAAGDFFSASRKLLSSLPHAQEPVSQLTNLVLTQEMSKALKVARTLIHLEGKSA
ncbi:putative flagellum biosynthesis repressor protein FlbT 1 [Alsobacter metallidurans]|uniref:Flagellum biosynthesis repressor protein FlbT 1 n=1 Tax=Alsobacter metallidurans TaxID=340221 RepID=A0A917I5X7_9HYPH|nr:putative flagellum biosynthesis repressor protein FlbT 1 [Alsobacter metallidurans]